MYLLYWQQIFNHLCFIDLCQGVHCKYGARCEEGKCVCPTECPEADEVVCANDGTTYRNECEMRSAACRHDQDLNVLFYGECDEVGETQGKYLDFIYCLFLDIKLFQFLLKDIYTWFRENLFLNTERKKWKINS